VEGEMNVIMSVAIILLGIGTSVAVLGIFIKDDMFNAAVKVGVMILVAALLVACMGAAAQMWRAT
jgi:uncharacterized MnhB-related membrane protein